MYVETAVDVSIPGRWVRRNREARPGEAAFCDRRRSGKTGTLVIPVNIRRHDGHRLSC